MCGFNGYCRRLNAKENCKPLTLDFSVFSRIRRPNYLPNYLHTRVDSRLCFISRYVLLAAEICLNDFTIFIGLFFPELRVFGLRQSRLFKRRLYPTKCRRIASSVGVDNRRQSHWLVQPRYRHAEKDEGELPPLCKTNFRFNFVCTYPIHTKNGYANRH